MAQYDITGMSCAACSARVEKAVSSLEGVSLCAVNLLTNSMEVSGSASDEEIISAVVAAGYGAAKKGSVKKSGEDKESANIMRRLLTSLAFLALLMYISMGHVMWGLPLPSFFVHNPIAIALAQMLLSAAVMIINSKFLPSLIHHLQNALLNQ